MKITTDWIGRRWFEMRVGYGTYMAFMFGFANFILLLHGLTDWFRDYPVLWFGLGMVAAIVPASILVGHRHNRTQQKTETRNLTHLNPYINTIVPNSKEVFHELYLHAFVELMILSTKNPGMKDELEKIRAAVVRYRTGEAATDALDREGVLNPDSHKVLGAGTPGGPARGGPSTDEPRTPGGPARGGSKKADSR